MLQLLETLAAELERPRRLPAQVIHHLSGTHGIEREAIGPFLVDELPKLEDYEIDLALSPVFTPTLKDQAVIAELLGQESVPATQWPALTRQLVTRPTHAQLITEDGQKHSVPLRDVTIERYVHRLRLDATIPGSLFKLLDHFEPAGDRPLLKAVARRAVWVNEARLEILVRYLTAAAPITTPSPRPSGERAGARGVELETKDRLSPTLSSLGGGAGEEWATTRSASYRLDDVVELLKLAEIYQPTDGASLLAQIPHWLQGLRQEINESGGGKPFFNERVEELHGGGRDQRRQNNSRVAAKENEQAFLERLQRVLAGFALSSPP